MSKALYIPIIVVIFLLSAPCVAPAEEQPAQEEFPEISTATLKIRLDTAPNFVLIDVRTEEEYVEGHIPEAINIPPDKLKNIEDYLPDDRELPLVFYCSGYV